tara:strand:- start:9966 stop:10367 length:402 start_codon:yes stop_codon:yes gene_type:complete
MQLDIVTPEKKAFSNEIESVVVPGIQGELGILSAHAPLVTTLAPGELRYLKDGEEHSLAIGTGIVEISNDRVSVLTDMAMGENEIDEDAVEKALESAQKAMTEKVLPEDIQAANILIQKQIAQLHIKRRRKRV